MRSLARHFLDFPYDRDLSLRIEEINDHTYKSVFKYLRFTGEPERFSGKHIFFGSVDKSPARNGELLNIHLYRSKTVLALKPIVTYEVRVQVSQWPSLDYSRLLNEIEEGRKARINSLNIPTNSQHYAWLFFLGEQDEKNPLRFFVEDYRLICCREGVWPFPH
jgi:hypothetical protein